MAQAMRRTVPLKSYEFRREREASWAELEALLEQIRKRGVKSLSPGDLARLPVLYRATLSSLSVARSISLDRNVVEYLESLAGRAYFVVYGTKRHLRDAVGEFFLRTFPRAVRRFKWHMVLAALFLGVGAVTGFFLTLDDPENFYSFVSPEYAQGRNPSASTEELKELLYDDGGGSGSALTTFATFLFTHNARIGMMAFALGFAVGLPVYLLLFINGLTLGAFGALYHSRGLSVDFWGWVLPHGVTELLAVILCGGAGLILAQALVFPGRHRRLKNLALKGREAGAIVLGAVFLFFVAGLIEGIFRQTVQSVPVRYAVIVLTTLFWMAYFGLAGRRAARAEEAE